MSEKLGKLVIIGGAEDKKEDCKILREVVRLAGGPKAQVVVVTVATDLPLDVGAEYLEVFEKLGVQDVRTFDVSKRDHADRNSSVKAIESATCVFFTGGDQVRITNLLGGTRVDSVLSERFQQGLILAGTSAGASMMSSSMIVTGQQETNPRLGMLEMGPGMEFLPGVVIDQHFDQRGRLGRLLLAAARYPHHIGLGIDEDTAIVVEGRRFEVIGRGAVTIVDASSLTYSNLESLAKNDALALCGVRLHILPAGERFDLHKRERISEESSAREGTRS
ncbi:MAG: cyanophycinase [Bacilli bacterium]|nr:cyanophycinase [Bacilli bacterium]